MDSKTLGILGGGQLGRMMTEAAHRLGIRIAILDPQGSASPSGQIASLCVQGSFRELDKIQQLAQISDVITTEIEHVNADALEILEKDGHVVHPNSRTIRLIQDKYLQKVHLSERSIPLPEFLSCPTIEKAREAGNRLGYPLMLKNRLLAYDGRGNAVAESENDIENAFALLGGTSIYAEKWVPYVKELAIMVVRTQTDVLVYPVVETIQQNNICHLVTAPAQISQRAQQNAATVALQAIGSLDGIGIYGVELFLLADDTVLLNEIAPRPHNSGHYTIEACEIDQFEMHLRAVLGLPCPAPALRVPVAMMINILGSETMEMTKAPLRKALTHRTPTRMYTYAQSAAERGLQVIIAGAGGAAHLPGMTAALTSLPVIGVPVKTSTLSGNDSLLSIVQMPKGIPVATVAIDNATNAGLLAVRILAAQDASLLKAMDAFMVDQEEEVLHKADKLEAIGHQAYLNGK
eukprot:gene17887-12822_t